MTTHTSQPQATERNFSTSTLLNDIQWTQTKMKQSIWGVEKKIFDMCEHYSYITFSVVIKIFQKKTRQKIIFLLFLCNYIFFFLQKIPSNQHPPPKNLHRPAIICGIITNQIWLKLANLPKWWPQMPNWQDLNISWMKRTAKMKDFGLVWDTMPKDLKLWQSQLIICPKR